MDIDLFLTNTGRLSRQAFWICHIVLVVTYLLILFLLDDVLDYRSYYHNNKFASFAVMAVMTIPSINLGIKRFHDLGKTGWWVLIGFVPIIGGLWYLIEAGFLPGAKGPNQYGPDPLS
jgi:uncharacterized membrane protein YhaH (DUF805 family)